MSRQSDSPPTVLVTGCSGAVGRAVIDHLLARDYTVRGIDLVAPARPEVDYRAADLLDAKSIEQHCEGVHAILHLAGWPGPHVPATDVFALNCSGTFNLFTAAATRGIKRVVVASSIHAVGFFFGPRPFALSHLPVREDHPQFTTDSYSFSKQVTEEIGDYFWRRDGISQASLRFGAGWPNPRLTRREEITAYLAARERAEELAAMPEAEVRPIIDRAQQTFDDLRGDRALEGKVSYAKALSDPDLKLMWMRHTFFSYVALEDACQAMELALTSSFEGSHTLNIVNACNILNTSAQTLSRLFFPDLHEASDLTGNQSLLDWREAAKLIDFTAETSPDRLLRE